MLASRVHGIAVVFKLRPTMRLIGHILAFRIQCMSKMGRGHRKARADGTIKLDKVYIWGRRDG
jgi:hypothetical protein